MRGCTMKKLIIIFLTSLTLFGCNKIARMNNIRTVLESFENDTDLIEIRSNRFNYDSEVASITLVDTEEISNLIEGIRENEVERCKCSFSAEIYFYGNGILLFDDRGFIKIAEHNPSIYFIIDDIVYNLQISSELRETLEEVLKEFGI